MDSNQYAIELVTYLLVLVVYFYKSIVYMHLERNAFDSIAFFSQYRIIFIYSIYWIYNFIRAIFFLKFEHLFEKNMYNSIIQSIAHLEL